MDLSTEIGRPKNKTHIEVEHAVNADIRQVLEGNFERAVKEAAPIAYRFKGATRLDTAKNIYSYLQNTITYRRDSDGYQDVRLPKYFHNSKVGDCKSFTLNTLAIWASLYPEDRIYFFYAGYSAGPDPTHVYALIEPRNSSPIIIDGCWYFFNSEKTYTLGFKSKNMQVRTLSGIGAANDMSQTEKAEYIRKVYDSLDSHGRRQFKDALRDAFRARMVMQAHDAGQVSGHDAMNELCAIEALGIGRRGRGKLGRKILHWFNVAALFLGRAAFLLFVTLNVNALASKLDKLNKWGRFGKINDVWYILGGNPDKLKKIAAHGARKKPLFLSHKAHVRYNAKFGGKRDAHGNLIQGAEYDSPIGIAPAVAAAAIAAVPVLGALIPKLIEAFKGVPGNQGQADAHEMTAQGQDVVESVNQSGGYNPNGQTINAMMPPGDQADFSHPMPAAARDQIGNEQLLDHTEEVDTDNEEISGIGDAGDVMAALTPALGSLAQVGFTELGKVISKSKNKTLRQIGDGSINVASEGFAAYAAQRAGYNQDASFLKKHAHKRKKKGINPLLLVGGAGVAAIALALALRPQQQQPMYLPAR